ncbi:hypothetical protein PVK06_028967 [Gossypium arboreum]|uniref:Uncharacterized protein n=1 Tax=Gossypium arboreum TaxID=29729 RepID=A0ABR0P5D7_GOSAR|nr:hypothetical protein PVK06_028967 [Gossypium arboreum]
MMGLNLSNGLGFKKVELGSISRVHLLHKRVTSETYRYVIDRMRQKLLGWKAKSLSLSGRITLAKSVLATIPTYVMQTMLVPKGVCFEMEKIICGFVWGSTEKKKGVHLVGWD